jgi:hypothetical protein
VPPSTGRKRKKDPVVVVVVFVIFVSGRFVVIMIRTMRTIHRRPSSGQCLLSSASGVGFGGVIRFLILTGGGLPPSDVIMI